jgi:hypothetical protein
VIVAGEFVALLTTDTLPVTLPAAVGANATFSVIDWLGVRTVPEVTPLALNPVPVAVTLEIVTFEFPLFVSVALNELLFPTFTFPKFKLVGFAPSRKVGATPIPLRAMFVGELGALLTSETEPLTLPAEVGRKATVIVVCCPAFIFKGSENPLTVKKAEPVSVTWVMLSVAVPVLLTIKTWDKILPTTPFPKLREVELT